MNDFIKNAKKGTNSWWAYLLTILSIVLGLFIGGYIVGLLLPYLKSALPKNDFGKGIGLFILIAITFSCGLIAFMLAFKQFHKRPILSLLGVQSKFNTSLYLKGFIVWTLLILTSSFIVDFNVFQNFISSFKTSNFLLLTVVGFLSIGIQSFFEEILCRGYILQGISLKVKNVLILVIINSLFFGILHFGYGIDSFLNAFIVGVTYIIIVLRQNQIEFVAGAHNAHNLVLSIVFIDLNEALNETFSWVVDWPFMFFHVIISAIFIGIAFKFFNTKKQTSKHSSSYISQTVI